MKEDAEAGTSRAVEAATEGAVEADTLRPVEADTEAAAVARSEGAAEAETKLPSCRNERANAGADGPEDDKRETGRF